MKKTAAPAAGKAEVSCEKVAEGMKITCNGKSIILSEQEFLTALKSWLKDTELPASQQRGGK